MKHRSLLVSFLVLLSATTVLSQSRPQILLHSAGNYFQEFKVFTSAGDAPAAAGNVRYEDSRHDVPENFLELLNLPPDWRKVEAFGPEQKPLAAVTREQPPASRPEQTGNGFWFLRHPWLSILFFLLGFYAAFAVGWSGGPQRGQHSFILNVCHLVGFLLLARAWNADYYYAYLTVLALALALAIYAGRIRIRELPQRRRFARGLTIACYAALFLLIQIKTYNAYAAWNSEGLIQFYVPKQDRGPVQVLGENEKVLAEFSLTGGIDCRNVLLWNAAEQPKALRIVSPRGKPILLELRKRAPRPEKTN